MYASYWAITVSSFYSALPDTDVGAWVKHWSHCVECDTSVSCLVGPEENCLFFRCREEVENEKNYGHWVRL